jgi:hypothetical protein
VGSAIPSARLSQFLPLAPGTDLSPFSEFRDEILNHEVQLNQQQITPTDTNNFALFMQHHSSPSKQSPQNFNRKGKFFQKSVFPTIGPPRGYSGSASRGPAPPALQFPAHNMPHQSAAPNNEFTSNAPPRVPCQICGKTSHQALDCFHRMDYAYQGRHPPSQLAAMAAHNTTN